MQIDTIKAERVTARQRDRSLEDILTDGAAKSQPGRLERSALLLVLALDLHVLRVDAPLFLRSYLSDLVFADVVERLEVSDLRLESGDALARICSSAVSVSFHC